MERLTTNNGGGHYLDLSDNPFSYDNIVCKLGAFEDFMEEQGFESLEDLKSTLKVCEDKYLKMNRDYQELQHCIWKDTPITQIRNNYERGHNFDFVGVAYNRGKAKIDRKVRRENEALKDRWNKLKELIEKDMEHNRKEYDESFCTAFNHYSASGNWVLDRMQELEQGESDAKD